jgi:hypothetical protein
VKKNKIISEAPPGQRDGWRDYFGRRQKKIKNSPLEPGRILGSGRKIKKSLKSSVHGPENYFAAGKNKKKVPGVMEVFGVEKWD